MNTSAEIAYLIEVGLTQEQIATKTGVNQSTISRIRTRPSLDCKYSTATAINKLYLQYQKATAA